LKIDISQGSVTMQLRRGGIFNNHFITNFPQNMWVKNFEKKAANIWRRYGQKCAAYFFRPPCMRRLQYLPVCPSCL